MAFANHALIYPNQTEIEIETQSSSTAEIDHFLWIDSTWQESHKMMRQSPWLKSMRKHSINNTRSTFRLRRNQKQDGLSTLESLAYWLMEQGHQQPALELLEHFHHFQEAFLSARQDGLLK